MWPGFAVHGITVERVVSDNGPAYRSPTPVPRPATNSPSSRSGPGPYRPQTKGKVQRFHRTLADGWAHARFYSSETERRAALAGWLHFYNHHRPHSAIGGPADQPTDQRPWTSHLVSRV